MKKLFDLLQKWTLELIILFAITPWLPVVFQKKMGLEGDGPLYATGAILLFSLIIFGLVIMWIVDGWFVQRPWRLSALVVASLLNIATMGAAILAMLSIVNKYVYLDLRGLPWTVSIGAALALWFIDWQDVRYHGKNTRTN